MRKKAPAGAAEKSKGYKEPYAISKTRKPRYLYELPDLLLRPVFLPFLADVPPGGKAVLIPVT